MYYSALAVTLQTVTRNGGNEITPETCRAFYIHFDTRIKQFQCEFTYETAFFILFIVVVKKK